MNVTGSRPAIAGPRDRSASTSASARAPAWEFAATGTRWRIYHSGGVHEQAARELAAAVELDEARWSRFRPDSELSALNRAAGRWHSVSAEMFALLDAADRWTRRSGGLFQPLVAPALSAWGYRDSIGVRPPGVEAAPPTQPVVGALDFDLERRAVRIPHRSAVDLGGIAKGWIAGRVAALAATVCADPVLLVDAGGDLVAASGEHSVAVDRPGADGLPPQAWIRLRRGQAVATSGYGRRQWVNGDGVRAHHLIDPATGAPGPLAHATVVADCPVTADVQAKLLALRPDDIHRTNYAALVVTPSGAQKSQSWSDVALA